jgi:hypothetical protein
VPVATAPVVAEPSSRGDIAGRPIDISERTGLPRRPVIIAVVAGLGYGSATLTCLVYAWSWWQAASISGYHESARLISWIKPDPVSFLTIVLVLTVALCTVLAVVAAGAVAYNAWHGKRWIRRGSWIALAVSCLTFLCHPWAPIAIVPLLAAAVLLHLSRAGRYFDDVERFRGDALESTTKGKARTKRRVSRRSAAADAEITAVPRGSGVPGDDPAASVHPVLYGPQPQAGARPRPELTTLTIPPGSVVAPAGLIATPASPVTPDDPDLFTTPAPARAWKDDDE